MIVLSERERRVETGEAKKREDRKTIRDLGQHIDSPFLKIWEWDYKRVKLVLGIN